MTKNSFLEVMSDFKKMSRYEAGYDQTETQ